MRSKIAVLLMLAALDACSSPYVYDKEITSFSSSVATVSSAITQGLADIDQDQQAADLAAVLASRTGFDVPQECAFSMADSPGPCRLLVHGVNPEPAVRPAISERELREDLGVLKAYAEGLAAVANAQDRKDYDAAATQLASSVGALASSIPSGPGAAAGVALPAVIKFATFTIGQSLDQARFDTLKSALNSVGDPPKPGEKSPIERVAEKVVQNPLETIQTVRIGFINAQLQANRKRSTAELRRPNALNVDRYERIVTETAPSTVVSNSVRAVNPAAVAASLVKAHNELKDAVNNPKTQYANLVKSITEFANQAETLAKTVTSKPAPGTKS